MSKQRKAQFWLDNSSGTLVDYSTWCNSASLEQMREILEDTGLNEDDVSVMGGIRSAQLPINGYTPTTDTGITKALDAAIRTSVTKTFQLKLGTVYYNGECLSDGVKLGNADGHQLIPFSTTLRVDGIVNKTSVAL